MYSGCSLPSTQTNPFKTSGSLLCLVTMVWEIKIETKLILPLLTTSGVQNVLNPKCFKTLSSTNTGTKHDVWSSKWLYWAFWKCSGPTQAVVKVFWPWKLTLRWVEQYLKSFRKAGTTLFWTEQLKKCAHFVKPSVPAEIKRVYEKVLFSATLVRIVICF